MGLRARGHARAVRPPIILFQSYLPGWAQHAAEALALGTAISMALLSSGLGWAIARGPVLGTLTLLFGCWYTLGAASLL